MARFAAVGAGLLWCGWCLAHLGRPGDAWGLLFYQLGGLPAGEFGVGAALKAAGRHAGVAAAGAVMLLAVAGGGGPGRRLLRLGRLGRGERLAVDVLLGTAVTGTWYFGLALAGLLTPAAVGLSLVPCAIAGSAQCRRPRFTVPAHPGWLTVAFGPVVVTAVLMLLPDTDGDAAFYHLAAPEQFLRAHRFVAGDASYTFHYPLLVDMTYVPAVAWGRDALAHIIGVLPWLAGVALLAGWCARCGGATAGWLAAWGILTYGLVGRLMILAKDDLGSAGFSIAGTVMLAHGCGESRTSWRAAGGMLLGCGLASKYSGALPLGVAWAAACWWHARGTGLRRFPAWAVLTLLPAAPWLGKNWLLLGDPLWPALSTWWPGALWSSEAEAGLRAVLRPGGAGLRFSDLPAALATTLAVHQPAVAVAAPVLLFRWRRLPGVAQALGLAAAAGLAWSWHQAPLADLRYGLPMLVLLVGVLAVAVAGLAGGWSRPARLAAGTAAVAAGWLPVGFLAAVCVHPGFALPWLGGVLADEAYLRGRLGALAAARAALAAEAGVRGVILAGEVRAYGMPGRRLVERSPGRTWEWTLARECGDPAAIRRRLRQLRATHLLVNAAPARMPDAVTRPFRWDSRMERVWRAFIARDLVPVTSPDLTDGRGGAYRLYRFRPPGPGSRARESRRR